MNSVRVIWETKLLYREFIQRSFIMNDHALVFAVSSSMILVIILMILKLVH